MGKLGELIGLVEEVVDRCLKMEVVGFVRLKIVRPVAAVVPQTLWLDVGDVRYRLWTVIEPRLMESMDDIHACRDREKIICPLEVVEVDDEVINSIVLPIITSETNWRSEVALETGIEASNSAIVSAIVNPLSAISARIQTTTETAATRQEEGF